MINRLKSWFDIKKVYIIVFLTLSFWAVFAYLTMAQLIKSQEVYAKLINISGKQRMLSQKTTLISKRYFESKDEQLKLHLIELIKLMKNDHSFLINNLTSKDTKEIYLLEPYLLDNEVNRYFELLDQFLEKIDIDTLKEIESYSFELLPKLNHAVNIFENESNQKTKQLEAREFLIMVGTLITLILEAIFIVVPSIRFARKKEKELEELNISLQHRIEKEVESQRKKDQVILYQAKMASLAEMLDNIAHQWRQPLSVITISATGIKLKQDNQNLKNEDLNMFIDKIVSSSTYLSSTIEEFRSFFLEEKEPARFSLDHAYDKAINMISSKLDNLNIKIIKEIDEFVILGLENELIQVILTILNNAKDALEKVAEKEKYIKINICEKDEDFIKIEIIDSGYGIDETIIDKVFEPYFTTKHKYQGTGMALYMARVMVVNHMKGDIVVKNSAFSLEDKIYNGAMFSITLPKDLNKVTE